MKRKKLLSSIAALSLFLFGAFLFITEAAKGGFEKELVPSFTELHGTWNDIHGQFILTRWRQDGEYAEFTPKNALLGWGGNSDGWFEYEFLAKQRKLQYIFTVIPNN